MRTIIRNGNIVNEGRIERADIVIDNEVIARIAPSAPSSRDNHSDLEVDATGCFVLPGVIDTHVHFREPGLTQKADIQSESRAAAYGGVTSFFDMPNTLPQTTSLGALDDKCRRAAQESSVNYAFFIGATNDNIDTLRSVDAHRVPGVKLFMGSSTGNMLVDRREALQRIFSEVRLPIMAHCEDTAIINSNMAEAKRRFGDDPDVCHHPEIRSAEACWASTSLAVQLARTYGARLHVAHLTTRRELDLFEAAPQWGDAEAPTVPRVTAEAVVAHLLFSDAHYASLGTRIKCNPSVKTLADRQALRQALCTGAIATIGTDHAPHQWADKQGGCARAASGMPMIQFSLVSMLQLVDEGVLPLTRLVELMCHHPAQLFSVRGRGFIREGYQADLVVVRPHTPWTLTRQCIQSKCQWSPLEGHTFPWQVQQTLCNGHVVYDRGRFDDLYRGQPVMFR